MILRQNALLVYSLLFIEWLLPVYFDFNVVDIPESPVMVLYGVYFLVRTSRQFALEEHIDKINS